MNDVASLKGGGEPLLPIKRGVVLQCEQKSHLTLKVLTLVTSIFMIRLYQIENWGVVW